MKTQSPPFRAEHIGSLLRPAALLALRKQVEMGTATEDELKLAEDEYIQEAIALQESVGLHSITDGEFRRGYYFGNFPVAVSGFTQMTAELDFLDEHGRKMKYTSPVVTGKLRRERGIATDDFEYVRAHTNRTPKVTMPSPCSQHYFRYREPISAEVYPDLHEFFADVATIYQAELAELAALGATYIQLDDVSLPLLCDTTQRARVQQRGYDPDQLVERYINVINAALANRPPSLTVGMHMCRGNNQGKWLGEGGYEYVAEKLFNQLDIDVFFMEYDSPRAGSFAPLRYMATDKHVVLGLISTKSGQMEDADTLKQRIEDASHYFPLAQLSLSPQCGFASTAPGNPLTTDEQRQKLELVVQVADQVWGLL